MERESILGFGVFQQADKLYDRPLPCHLELEYNTCASRRAECVS